MAGTHLFFLSINTIFPIKSIIIIPSDRTQNTARHTECPSDTDKVSFLSGRMYAYGGQMDFFGIFPSPQPSKQGKS